MTHANWELPELEPVDGAALAAGAANAAEVMSAAVAAAAAILFLIRNVVLTFLGLGPRGLNRR
ncbi:hypothetical protein [Nocardia arthritidis]|uniref:Uncharacterized protein n=1 Tax=Nocardia arthritidis TaxID=228602 RepID=A0A6G9Y7P7_9NOCA|nr:hypothetical protein [Nocardia arthritidis]QIS09140.1 hypothetical protein F5544_06145 [Nocardia arthritidis]